ncbi:hypothetical protein BSNK01_15230 [Bacillaceae bacterium]
MRSLEKDLREALKEIEAIASQLHNVSRLDSRLAKLAALLEKARIGDLIENYSRPRRVLYINFLVGLARGLGLTIGTALVLTVLGFVLKEFVSLPYIGQYISDIVEYVQIDQYYRRLDRE